MKQRHRWVDFFPDKVPNRKTKQWTAAPARDKETGKEDEEYAELGVVKWYAPWRRYCFFPVETTWYDAACLREIADFCERETREHGKAQRLAQPEKENQ